MSSRPREWILRGNHSTVPAAKSDYTLQRVPARAASLQPTSGERTANIRRAVDRLHGQVPQVRGRTAGPTAAAVRTTLLCRCDVAREGEGGEGVVDLASDVTSLVSASPLHDTIDLFTARNLVCHLFVGTRRPLLIESGLLPSPYSRTSRTTTARRRLISTRTSRRGRPRPRTAFSRDLVAAVELGPFWKLFFFIPPD